MAPAGERVRRFRVAKIRTNGPSNRIRGEFLVELAGRDPMLGRIWNSSRRRPTLRWVPLDDATQVAEHRAATKADLLRFGHPWRGAIGS